MNSLDLKGTLLIVVLLCSGCGRFDVTRGKAERLGPGSWTVDGITIGSSYEEVERILGAGKRVNPHSLMYYFNHRQTEVIFDSNRKVERVWGQRLMRDGQRVLAAGNAQDYIFSKLGKGYVVKRYSYKTIGVFTTLSRDLIGTDNYYHDGTNRFALHVNTKNTVTFIQYAPIDKFPYSNELYREKN